MDAQGRADHSASITQIMVMLVDLTRYSIVGGVAFLKATQNMPTDPEIVKSSIITQLFLKLAHHCAKHIAVNHRKSVLMAPNTPVFFVDIKNVYLSPYC